MSAFKIDTDDTHEAIQQFYLQFCRANPGVGSFGYSFEHGGKITVKQPSRKVARRARRNSSSNGGSES